MGRYLRRRRRGIGPRRGGGAHGADVLLVLPVSIAWTVDDDHVAVVEQAIDESGGAEMITEVVAPALPGDVARDDRRELLIVPGEQHLLHEAGAARLVAFDLLEADL